jgi:tetratricopeptide (TPR) repeat protein
MKVIVKLTFLFLLCFGAAVGVSAQSVLWETYSDSGRQAYGRGNYAEAEKLFKAALKEAENLKDPELIAVSNVHLGSVYAGQQKWDEAEKLFLKAIEIRERIGDKDSNEITYALSNLGLIYAEQKKYDKAEEILRRAITIREKTESPDLAVALLNLGKVYAEQKKLTEAQVVYEKAFELFLLAEDGNIAGIVRVVSNLSLIYEETNNYKKLEPAYRIIIDLIGKNNSMTDSSLVPYLEKYAVLLRKLKRNTEALKVEARAKKIQQLSK